MVTETGSLKRAVIDQLTPYVPGKSIEEVRRELGLSRIIKLASNENPLGPSPRAVQAMVKELQEVHVYPNGKDRQLREAIADRCGLKPEMVIFSNGEDNILTLITQAFLETGEESVVASITFHAYTTATIIAGGRVCPVPLKDYTHDLEAMLEAINEKTKLVFICNPNNPTGTMVTKGQADWFMERVGDEVLVIFDEAYGEYADRDQYPDAVRYVKEGRNVLVLRTFSKLFGLAGVRVGYALGKPDLIRALAAVREPFAVDRIGQAGALAVLEDEEYIRRSKEVNRDGKEFLYRELDRMGLSYVPTQANFILVDTGKKAELVHEAMQREGVIIRPAHHWGLKTKIRVTIGTREQNQWFISALQKVLARV